MTRDWADSEDHDFLNEFLGRTIVEITTGEFGTPEGPAVIPWLRFHLDNGRTLEVESSVYHGVAWITVQDHE